jgi:branched-chain amino acid transport system ATP-binding protein
MSILLEIKNLSAGYGGAAVLDAISLKVEAGTCACIVGLNGAGKSTLIWTILGKVRPISGEVLFDGHDVTNQAVDARVRQGLALVPEGRRVFPGLTVRENLEVSSRGGAVHRSAGVERVFDLFPVLAERSRARAWKLSGGQQQMLAIGRALMTSPKLILMDEPTLGLSPVVVRDVVAAIGQIVRSGTGVLIAEQNQTRLLKLDTAVLRLADGALVGP